MVSLIVCLCMDSVGQETKVLHLWWQHWVIKAGYELYIKSNNTLLDSVKGSKTLEDRELSTRSLSFFPKVKINYEIIIRRMPTNT